MIPTLVPMALLLAVSPPAIDMAVLPASEPVQAQLVATTHIGESPPVPGTLPAAAPAAAMAPEKITSDDDQQDIVVTGSSIHPVDPLESVNIKSYAATKAVDQGVARPVAMAYLNTVPKPVRRGLRNFLENLHEPVSCLNFLLQFKVGKAFETLARFSINTTAGVAGVMDVAKTKTFKLPRRKNGFANTLGYYGVKPGVFFYLPFIGPTTLRDVLGGTIDRMLLPIAVGGPFGGAAYTAPMGVLSAVDNRATNDERIMRFQHSENPYAASRRAYLERRQAQIDELHSKSR